MIKILFSLLLIIPLAAGAQKKNIWQRQREATQLEREQRKMNKSFTGKIDESGFHLQKASNYLIYGTVCELVGGGVIAAGSSNNTDGENDALIAGGGILIAGGIVFQIISAIQLSKAGKNLRESKITFTKSGLSYTF